MNKSELIAGRYLIINHIGKGGMADVYVAVDTVLNREVAVKVLKGELSSDPVALERFKREAQASTRLSHPNIVDIYDVGDDGVDHYIVMEYIKGQTLKQLIQKRGVLYYTEAVSMMKQLCSAIMESHRNGIIHRDIKSQNVLIKDDGTVKIVDFGIALANNAMQITSQDNVLGSVHYIAPEVAKGEIATMQSDIYSLGIVFYELLCGSVPFKGDSAVQVVMNSIKKPIPRIRDFDKNIPQAVENIVLKATAKNVNNRYKNVADMLKDLNDFTADKLYSDKPIVFEYPEDLSLAEADAKKKNSKGKTGITKKKTERRRDSFMAIYITLLTVITIFIVFLMLYFGGIIEFDAATVTVPDILGKRILEANEILDGEGLVLNLDDIERVLTEDTEEGLIIETDPEVGTEVEKGTTIKVTVSSGIYAIMDDYVGENFETARTTIQDLYPNIRVVGTAVVSDLTPGTVISQEGIEAGEQFDPSDSSLTITLTYSAYVSEIIPINIIGMDVNEASETLADMGIETVLEAITLDELDEYTDEEKESLVAGTVVRTDPEVGTSYMQMSDTYVTLYYLEDDE